MKGDPIFEGVDLDKALDKMLKLPSAKHLRIKPEFTVRRSKTKAYTTGHAHCSFKGDPGRITMTIGYDATIHRVLGTLLHEVAHHATRLAPGARKGDWNDSSLKFAKRCHNLHDEWNQRWGKRIAEVSVHLSGAYLGRSARRDVSKSHVPGSKGLDKPAQKKPSEITIENNHLKTYWKRADELHPHGVTVAIPGTLATELEHRCVDVEDGSEAWRLRLVEIWSEGTFKRVGKGHQRIAKFGPGELTRVLHKAIEWAVWDYGDEPLADRQAAKLLSSLLGE